MYIDARTLPLLLLCLEATGGFGWMDLLLFFFFLSTSMNIFCGNCLPDSIKDKLIIKKNMKPVKNLLLTV